MDDIRSPDMKNIIRLDQVIFKPSSTNMQIVFSTEDQSTDREASHQKPLSELKELISTASGCRPSVAIGSARGIRMAHSLQV